MDEEQKAKQLQGRITAKDLRDKASTLIKEYGSLLQSWSFWKNIPASERKAVSVAIRKADRACLDADIKAMQTQLNAKIAEKERLDKKWIKTDAL